MRPIVNDAALAWSGTGENAIGVWIRDGKFTLLATGPVDLLLTARGHRIEKTTGVFRDQTVCLRKQHTVQIRLPLISTPPNTSVRLFIRPRGLPADTLRPRFGTDRMALSSYLAFQVRSYKLGTARSLSIPVREGEVYDLRVGLGYRERFETLEGYRPKELRATGTRQSVDLKIPSGSISSALERIQR